MKKPIVIITLVLAASLGLGAQYALSDDDDDHERGHDRWRNIWKPTGDVAAVHNPRYVAECGSCHMAYPPGLLPARAWVTMMSGLQDHFGDNAELDQTTTATLARYLVENSADSSDYRRSRRIMRSLPVNTIPLRISDLPYIRHEHDEIPARMITANPNVRSLSNCNACHMRAEQGSFREREISIPGYGRWDD